MDETMEELMEKARAAAGEAERLTPPDEEERRSRAADEIMLGARTLPGLPEPQDAAWALHYAARRLRALGTAEALALATRCEFLRESLENWGFPEHLTS